MDETEIVPVEVSHTVEVPVAETAEPALDPMVEAEIIRGDTEIAVQEQVTERAAIEARAAVAIAKIEAEEPEWLQDIRASSARMEARMEAMELMLATMVQPSTQPPSVTVVTEPEAPVVTEPETTVVVEPESGVVMPESQEVPAAEPEAPAKRKPRWI